MCIVIKVIIFIFLKYYFFSSFYLIYVFCVKGILTKANFNWQKASFYSQPNFWVILFSTLKNYLEDGISKTLQNRRLLVEF